MTLVGAARRMGRPRPFRRLPAVPPFTITARDGQARAGVLHTALAFDECTPFHVERDYTARSMERTHRWLDRCLAWHGEHAPAGQLLYGIVQGGVYEDLRAEATAYVAGSGVDGIAIGGSLGQEKAQ